ncbi:MAG: YraN family protein [Clostridia bacterium]|nr:YraN family protein [Clostridia bacterium]
MGEAYAADLLREKGYLIVKRNYSVGKSELDLVAENEETFAICEVKTRIQEYGAPSRYGLPSRAVTKEKRRHLLPASSLFCRKHQGVGKPFRFDVIEVYLNKDLSLGHIEHYENLWMK